MNESSMKTSSSRKAAFGIIAIVCFCVAVGLCWWGGMMFMETLQAWAMVVGATQGKPGLWNHDYAIWGGVILWLIGLAFAITSLVRREIPRWPAIVGLVLCMLPLALVMYGFAQNALRHE